METALVVFAIIFGLTGLIGCVLPGLPGPPLAYAGLLLLQWAFKPFSLTLLVITAVVTLIITVVDYYIPIWTSKKFGATKQGIWGSIIGMTLGIFFTPVGMIAGLVIGAIAGDLIAGQTASQAAKAASGTLFGTLITIGLKLSWCIVLFYYMVSRIIMHYY